MAHTVYGGGGAYNWAKKKRFKTSCIAVSQYELRHTLPTPRYGEYHTHAHNHITPAVAAVDSCFVLVRTHRHGTAITVSLTFTDLAPIKILF